MIWDQGDGSGLRAATPTAHVHERAVHPKSAAE